MMMWTSDGGGGFFDARVFVIVNNTLSPGDDVTPMYVRESTSPTKKKRSVKIFFLYSAARTDRLSKRFAGLREEAGGTVGNVWRATSKVERNPTSCEIENGWWVRLRERYMYSLPFIHLAYIHPFSLRSGAIKHRDIDIRISAWSHLPLQDKASSGHGSESNARGYGISAHRAKVVHVVNGLERQKPRRVMAGDALRSGSADPPTPDIMSACHSAGVAGS